MSLPLNPVSPALVKARYLTALSWCLLVIGCSAVVGMWWTKWAYGITAAVFAVAVWLLWLIPMQVRNMGWLETENELLITKGKLWHTFTVVPYGRIQFVDVTAGPIAKLFGLKAVKLHTASATSDTKIEGLDTRVADALRERLSLQARERMSGL